MRLRRFLTALLAALAVGVLSVSPATSAAIGDGDNSCADVQEAAAQYVSNTTTVAGQANLATTTCRGVTYRMDVYTVEGTPLATAPATVLSESEFGTALAFTATVVPQAGPLCVTIGSYRGPSKVLDLAPDGALAPCATGGPTTEDPPAGGWH